MTPGGTGSDLDWRGDVPVSTRFDDPYFSLEDGMAETRHVFLDGNDLPARFHGDFHIGELGFGTGLNAAVALQAWQASGQTGRLRYTSFEMYPMDPDAMTRALAAFPELGKAAQAVTRALQGHDSLIALEVIQGDANATLPAWAGKTNAWFLDGFAPAKNPDLWGDALLAQVARHTAPGGTVATYSAAGHIRRGLEAAGFDVRRAPGFARKRHMTRGVLA